MNKDESNCNDLNNEKRKGFFDNSSESAVKKAVASVIKDLNDFLEEKKDYFCRSERDYKNKIQKNPLKCALGVLTVGVILGIIFKR